jgi:hypothetical protein
MEVFEKILPLKPRREEAFREDLMLLDSAGGPVAFVEVKGVSRGVAREQVNQADIHRERAGVSAEFPSLLIVNTNMKAASIADKDRSVDPEQIRHAVRNNVLILRTLDLLNLASLHSSGKLGSEAVVELLTKSSGWLRVADARRFCLVDVGTQLHCRSSPATNSDRILSSRPLAAAVWVRYGKPATPALIASSP